MSKIVVNFDREMEKPGTWKLVAESRGKSATMRCPKCGIHISIGGADYMIDRDGGVEPSVRCSLVCGFRGSVVLEGWRTVRSFLAMEGR